MPVWVGLLQDGRRLEVPGCLARPPSCGTVLGRVPPSTESHWKTAPWAEGAGDHEGIVNTHEGKRTDPDSISRSGPGLTDTALSICLGQDGGWAVGQSVLEP